MSRLSKKIRNHIFKIKDPVRLSRAINLYYFMSRKRKFSVFPDDDLLRVVDHEGREISIIHGIRLGFYRSGVKARVDQLMSDYMIDLEKIEDGDCIIDCGANIGELGVGFALNNKKVNYISFEPGSREYKACAKNNPGFRSENCALWNKNEELKFYEKSDTADSSVIEISSYDEIVTVKAIRLDDFCKNESIESVKYLKVEAEGAEPEVLEGAVETLKRTQYVCVDCGFERGIEQSSTLPDVTNFLLERGFSLAGINGARLTALFVNTAR